MIASSLEFFDVLFEIIFFHFPDNNSTDLAKNIPEQDNKREGNE